MNTILRWAAVVALLATGQVWAEIVPFDSPRWQLSAQESSLGRHLGRDALMLKGGMAWLPDASFENGTITFDMSFSGDRGFAGLAFRIADRQNYEHFYLRAHRSGYPDANQYTPVFNGVSGWQLYFGPRYSVLTEYPFDEWFAVKIVVSGDRAEVYIKDMENPALFLPDLKRDSGAGGVGINAANFAPAWFSNFRFDARPAALSGGLEAPEETIPEDHVSSWQISNTFALSGIEGVHELPPEFTQSLTWARLDTEPPGFANIARLRGLGEGENTVFARLVLESSLAQTVVVEFGYSDLARVYLNGRLLYAGNNTYMTRDFRYLGTIGLFDAVALPLESGENQLWIAVTEQFGGWGVMARQPQAGNVTIR